MSARRPGMPASCTGTARSVPLVSFEGACGQPLPPVASRTRIVVFHALGGKLQAGYFGIADAGFSAAGAGQRGCRPAGSVAQLPGRVPVICQVRMVNETPLIPDLERLEQMIAEETSVIRAESCPLG